jgi:hypothetical protein
LKDFKKRIRPRPPFLAAHVLSVFLLLPGLILMLTAMATAQVGSASRSGVVQDQCSAAVPDASVTPENALSASVRVVKSNGAGSFSFAAVLLQDSAKKPSAESQNPP